MNKSSHPNRSSIDGFVPNSRRQVGFGEPSHRPKLDSSTHRLRMRRPALHTTPEQPARKVIGETHPQSRRNFPEFTTYTAPDSLPKPAASGHGRHGKLMGKQLATTKKPSLRQRLKNVSWKRVAKRGSIVLGVFVLLCGAWLGWKLWHNSKVFGGGSNLIGFLNATKLRGEDQGRVNILLAGVSTDNPGHQGANLTDSIMLVSLDTRNNKAFMLSIPRDLWVDIPGYGHSKINAANAYGDSDKFNQPGYPRGGIGLLEQTLAQHLQLPIHYYAKINYTAFRDAVNAVGGITVTIKSSDPRGLYDPNISPVDGGPLRLKNGTQKLNGQAALNLARARGNPTADGRYGYGFPRSDFDRTQNQRMMMVALKNRVSDPAVIANPLKVGQLFDALGKNIKTDFKPSEIRRLYDLNKQIGSSNIQSLSLNDANGVNLLASYMSPDGASALAPAAGVDNFSQIRLFLKKMMSNDPVVKESAKVVVLNGGNITGLASKEANTLTSKGMQVLLVGDAPRKQVGANLIIDQSKGKKGATKAKLQQLFGNNITTKNTIGYPAADFIIVIGTNQKSPQE